MATASSVRSVDGLKTGRPNWSAIRWTGEGRSSNAAPRCGRRPRIDRNDVVSLTDDLGERRDREFRRPHEDDPQAHAPLASRFATFLNFVMTRSRLSFDR